MKKLRKLLSQLDEGIKGQEEEISKIIRESEKEILDLNKQQLFKGEDATGKSLGEYISKSYAKFKLLLNPLGVVDLMLTGKFYDGFFLKKYSFPIKIDSKDPKRDALVKRKGENIFGLNEESIRIFGRGTAKKKFAEYWKRFLHV